MSRSPALAAKAGVVRHRGLALRTIHRRSPTSRYTRQKRIRTIRTARFTKDAVEKNEQRFAWTAAKISGNRDSGVRNRQSMCDFKRNRQRILASSLRPQALPCNLRDFCTRIQELAQGIWN